MPLESIRRTSSLTLAQPNAAQIRAARALLDWSQQILAERSGIARRTVAAIETGDDRVTPASIQAVRDALEAEGIVFLGLDGGVPGVEYAQKNDPDEY